MQTDLASHLDLANHHGNATQDDIVRLCSDVITYGFNGAFVNPTYISLVKEKLGGKAKVGTALSFPLGQDTVEMKMFAARQAIQLGADELDIVPDNSFLLTNNPEAYKKELKAIVDAARAVRKDIIVKFILETGYFILNEQEISSEERNRGISLIKQGSLAIVESGADFVKICSGMGRRGASLTDVKIVRETIGDREKIKVAGGIDTLEEAKSFLDAGVDRIGTSKAVEIIKEAALQV